MTILKTLRTLIGYLLCGGLFLAPFVVLAISALFGSRWAFNSLYCIDLTICSLCHGTQLESISARSYRLRADRRYYYQMCVIDLLAKPFDGEHHCKRALEWEQRYFKLMK